MNGTSRQKKARRGRIVLCSVLVFLISLPPAFFVGITLISHARQLPYMSVWIDRLIFAIVSLGLPALAAAGYSENRAFADHAQAADREVEGFERTRSSIPLWACGSPPRCCVG
jgi:hypothetical protein